MQSKKITIRDVAKEANVSIATVSRALNNNCHVKKNTLDSIFQAIEKLGYQYGETKLSDNTPSAYPTGTLPLTQSDEQTDKILLMNIPDMSNPFYSKTIDGVLSSANMRSMSVVFTSFKFSSDNVDKFIHMIHRLKANGVITLNSISPSALKLITSHVPVVQCCEYFDNPYASYVGIDDFASTELALNYFLSIGRKKISIINGPIEFNYARIRLAAYKSIMASANIDYPSNWIIQLPELNHDLAFTSIVQVLSSPNPPDCFFAISDNLAAAAIKAVQYCNLKVPSDVLVIGFDNTNISQLSTPSITTIKQPCSQLGYLASELLIEKINNPDTEIKQVQLPTELIIRESTSQE